MFAHAVYLGDRNWNLKEASDILVTLSEELNIVIPANEANPAVYIDVPLDSILEVFFDNALIPDSQQPIYGVVIRLDGGVTSNCILNAIGYVEHHTALAFSSDKDANTLKRLLVPTNFRADGLALRGRSGVSDASEPQILSEDELAAPGPALSNSQVFIETASLEDVIIPHGNPAGTINPSMLERGHSSQRASTERDEGSLIIGHRVAMAAEGIDVSQNDIVVEQAIEGIDVSQNEDLSHEETQPGKRQACIPDKASSNAPVQISQALGNGKRQAVGRFDRALDTGPSSSLRWRKGHNAIQNVPQLCAQPSQQAVSYVKQVENRRDPEGQDGEDDDLYYASPKATNARRWSPRSMALGNTPKTMELSLVPIVRQANAKSGPPVKLSRQLRNAEGVVELHTEQTADDGLTALTKNDAVDVKTSANRNKIKVPAPAKIGNGLKGSAKPAKKIAQSQGKAVATKEPADSSLDSYDLPPSPRRTDAIQTPGNKTQATKAPRNKQKKAKPMPTQAATAALSKKAAPQPRDELKNNAKAIDPVQNSPLNRPSSKKIDDEDDAIWDVEQAHGEEERQITRQSRQPAKTARNQDVRVPKQKRNKAQTQLQPDQANINKPLTAHDQDTVASLVKGKAAPAALSQRRPRRTAAIKANKKIQGIEDSDEIVDDEETEPGLTRIKRQVPLNAAKSRKDQKIRNGEDYRPTSGRKLPTANLSTKDFVPDSVSPNSSDKEIPESVSDTNADSSPEKVNLPREAAAEALGAVTDNKRDNIQKGNSTSAAEISMIPLHSEIADRSNQPDIISAEHGAGLSEARVDLVPGSVPQLRESITKTEPAPISSQRDEGVKQGHYDLDNTRSVGPGAQDEVENVVHCIGDGSLTLKSNLDDVEKNVAHPQAPTAPMTVRTREERTSPRPTGAVGKTLPEPTPTRRDPFVAKLNASMPPSKGTNAKVKSSDFTRDVSFESRGPNTLNSGELERSLPESKARALNTPGAVPSGEAEPVGTSRRRLKSPMQMDGESSTVQSLKPAGESIFASGVEAKRKPEQIGDTSNKRVKVVSKERLKGVSAKRSPTFDANKTPPPVVSNRPLVIGFSASGPRNQGTISTKKSKPSKDVGNGALDVAELHKHEIPNPAVSQVHAHFASNQEALEISVEGIQHEVKLAAGAQKEAPGSTQRKQAGHLKSVNAAVTGEAQTQENGAEKRKSAPSLDDPAPGEHEQLSKRQKRNMETPPTAQKHHPQMFPDMSPALIHDRSQRISSQNTRVNENGSPMPFFITRNGSTIAEEQYSDDEDDGKDALAEARLVERLVLQEDDPMLPEPILPLQPLASAASTTQPKARAYQSLSNNSKQVPSSPHASSAFGTMPPHHLYDDGEIVNAETKQSILPAKPQDPFLGATQRPPNSFMDALRKSTEFAAKSLVPGAEAKGDLCGVLMRQDINAGEDPDKTLVEPDSRRRYRKVHVSDSSSSSQSGTSTQLSQPYESSEEDSEAETEARWRKGLEPHQENMLECLLTISHVSNDLTILLARH